MYDYHFEPVQHLKMLNTWLLQNVQVFQLFLMTNVFNRFKMFPNAWNVEHFSVEVFISDGCLWIECRWGAKDICKLPALFPNLQVTVTVDEVGVGGDLQVTAGRLQLDLHIDDELYQKTVLDNIRLVLHKYL